MLICPYCSHSNPLSSTHCISCGAELSDSIPPTPTSPDFQQPPKTSSPRVLRHNNKTGAYTPLHPDRPSDAFRILHSRSPSQNAPAYPPPPPPPFPSAQPTGASPTYSPSAQPTGTSPTLLSFPTYGHFAHLLSFPTYGHFAHLLSFCPTYGHFAHLLSFCPTYGHFAYLLSLPKYLSCPPARSHRSRPARSGRLEKSCRTSTRTTH
jgi:hypothetical protein